MNASGNGLPSPRAAPIGTRLIDSTPPATTRSYWPAIRPAAAKCTDCCEEPHCRSMVTPVTDSGQPAVRTAVRAMSKVCSPTWPTQPQMTSSTSAASPPARSTSAFSTCADRFAGCPPDSPPLRLPTGVRTASTITASRMSCPLFGVACLRPPYVELRILNTSSGRFLHAVHQQALSLSSADRSKPGISTRSGNEDTLQGAGTSALRRGTWVVGMDYELSD